MRITERVAKWTAPADVSSTDGPFRQICAIDATPMLPHTVGKRHYRKNAPAVAAITQGVVTVDELVAIFRKALEEATTDGE